MATNTLAQRLKINGLIDTNQDVVANMERIARNATSWLGYDTSTGKWAVVINKAGTSVKSFDDSNIVGPISVTGKDVTELFNRAEIKYPLRDSADKTDTIVLETPSADRNAFEKDKTLNITYDMVNEPVQAQLLGLIELKQSRVDTIVEFTADYSTINVQAGDIIDITNEHLGYSNKLFRVASLEEAEGDGGAIVIRYQCLEYDPDIYDETALTRYIRTDRTNIASLGYIADPDTAPVVSVEPIDDVPYHSVTMNVPDGIVTELELWVSFDNTNWDLNHTVFPKDYGEDKVTMTPNDDITVRRTYLTIPREAALGNFTPTGSYTVYWKYRGKNTQNWSAFSSVTSVTWDPVVTSGGQWVSSTMINPATGNAITSTSGNTFTAGEIYGTAAAQLGSSSSSNFASESGVSIPTKDTNAPAFKNVTVLYDDADIVSIMTQVNSLTGTVGNVTSYGNATQASMFTTPGLANNVSLYNTVTLQGVNYDSQVMDITLDIPGGEYDLKLNDPVVGSTVTITNLKGYVPTYTAVWHQPWGNASYYLVASRITNTDEPQVTFNLTTDLINQARELTYGAIGNISSMAGNVRVYQGLFPGYENDFENTEVYPYNWSTFSTYIPNYVIKTYQE